MNTISMILAWTVGGIIALVGGAVIGMALSNSLNAKYRRNNWVAWQILTHQVKHGDIFIITKNKELADIIQGIIDGKLFAVKTKRTARYRQDIAALIDLAGDFIGTDKELRSLACIEAAIKHGIWLQKDYDLLKRDKDEVKPA